LYLGVLLVLLAGDTDNNSPVAGTASESEYKFKVVTAGELWFELSGLG